MKMTLALIAVAIYIGGSASPSEPVTHLQMFNALLLGALCYVASGIFERLEKWLPAR